MDANIRPESLNPLLSLIDWREAALLQLLGVNNEPRFKFTDWPYQAPHIAGITQRQSAPTPGESAGFNSQPAD